MVISLQISAVSGRVLPTCLDHSALICEAAESLRTAEHASLEWIYALREVQKAEKKKRYYIWEMKFSIKKIPHVPWMRQNKEAQSHKSALYDSLMIFTFFFFLNSWMARDSFTACPMLAGISGAFKNGKTSSDLNEKLNWK